MKVLLIRHGRTQANDRHLYCGFTDLPLSQEGREALKAIRESGTFPDPAGYRVITSGMRRCEETLSLLFGELPHQQIPALGEMNFGAFEMRSYDQLKEDPAYLAWITGDNEQNLTPGGESGALFARRVLPAFEALCAQGEDLLIVTHGGVIALIMAHLFPETGCNRYQWQPAPGRGYLLERTEAGRWRILN